MPTFSVVTATYDAPNRLRTLERTIDSVQNQLQNGDEYLIVGDGPQEWARLLAGRYPRVRYLETPEDHTWGNVQRQAGLEAAHGSHLIFIDDDNVMAPGALAVVREAVAEKPTALFLFRTLYFNYAGVPDGGTVWRIREIRHSNVDSGNIVIPRRDDLVSWLVPDKRLYEADYHFILNNAAVIGEVVWREEILTIVRPN